MNFFRFIDGILAHISQKKTKQSEIKGTEQIFIKIQFLSKNTKYTLPLRTVNCNLVE